LNNDGNPCLHLAANNGHKSTVCLLLEDGRVVPSVLDNDGNTCLHLAANNGHESTVILLLEDGRVDPIAINNEELDCLSVTTHPTIRKMLQDERRNRLSIAIVCLY
jgi:ankyrin repeat protein